MLVRKRCDTRSESWPGGITLTLVLVLRLKRFDGSSKPMRSYVIRSAERHMTLHCEPREGEGAAVESNPFVQSHSVPNRFALGLNRGFHNKSFSTPTRYRNFSTRCSGVRGRLLRRNSFPMVTSTPLAIGAIIFLTVSYEIAPHHYSSS